MAQDHKTLSPQPVAKKKNQTILLYKSVTVMQISQLTSI